jgi:hypothetical protein
MPLRKNQAVPALEKPPPIPCANTPRSAVPMTRRPRLALSVPSSLMLWLAQVALRAKKNVQRKEGNKGKGPFKGASRRHANPKAADPAAAQAVTGGEV